MTRFLLFVFLLYAGNMTSQSVPIQVAIPMSDGEFLAGDLYLPNETDVFPTIFVFTPYGKFFYALNGLPLGIGDDISDSDFAILIVDWRCRFASMSACASGSDDGEDGHDVVEWIASQSWSDEKVGMWGPSALGNVQFNTAKTQPPHLTCCVPEVASPQSTYLKYFPGGSCNVETLESLDFLFPGVLATIIGNPYQNFIWDIVESTTLYPDSINVPMLLVGGWYDQNITQTILWSDLLSTESSESQAHKTLIGPWVHGGTGQAVVGSTTQGELEYPAAENWNVAFAMEFFDFHLRDIPNGWDQRDRYTFFQMGDGIWNESEEWPPQEDQAMTLYLREDNSLSSEEPPFAFSLQSFSYDPNDPSPTIGGKTLNLDLLQGPYDQADLVETRTDNLIFTTSTLAEDIIVQGNIEFNLFITSDRIDTDFVVRLTEVYPDGRSFLLSDNIQRMRFLDGYYAADENLISIGGVYEVPLILEDLATTFKAGNQLRIIISSSNYPRFNRNMNTGGEMYPNNSIDTLVNPLIATNTIYTSSEYASNIVLPIGFNTPDSVDDIADDPSKFTISPNPASTTILVSGEEIIKIIRVHSVDGELVLSKDINGSQATLDIRKLSTGSYLLEIVTTNGNHYSEKMIVKR